MQHNPAPSSSLPLVRVDEFLPPIRPWLHFGGLFIIAVVALAFPVASATRYQTTVKAPAIVAIATDRAQAPLQLKVSISPNQINQLKVGQSAQVRISGCPYTDYGILNGTVEQVAAMPIQPPMNSATPAISNHPSPSNMGVPAYEVTITPQHQVLGKGEQQCLLRVGMDGSADIASREETVLQFLLRKARLIADL
jgi:multidrug efflux pump subunit AcrA (membrane-fusion protein)